MTALDCTRTRSYLMAYLDSELDAATTVDVGAHLRGCAPCRRRFEAELRLERGLRDAVDDDPPMPDAVWARLAGSLRAEARPARTPRSRPRVLRWLPLAAAAVVLVALGLLLHLDLLRGEGAGSPAAPAASSRPLAELFLDAHRAELARHVAGAEPVDLAPLDALLAGSPAAALDFPRTSILRHHPLELEGARRVVLDARTVLVVRYECCGEPVSVFVTERGGPDDPAPLPGGFGEGAVRGRLIAAGDLLVGVVSRHPNPLAEYWAG